ncbi:MULTISPECIES: NAD(P)-dependent oxidoreductase [unclassified Sphingobium]|uniref:NAD(P)-dependent oxidoreductase n=1 Tax=unclassified Sphingobium TaxID=2611147 RepID=UPI002225AD78|nr:MULTISPECIES: NAD(P)H-binding protein [unclassified Sphingobium]MCW2394882.1 putative NADH-flavin reductase [Sphingobium sp. B8D3B]MCW2418396.1 putative NADH-flavin reductase [Sphingobium sp. B8D3C]
MKIAIMGATGNAGQRLVDEAVSRGHNVTGISRSADTQAPRGGVTWVKADINDVDDMASKIAGHDAVILSMPFKSLDADNVFAVARKAGCWLLVVGGAASLQTEDGVVLLDTPGFPDFIKVEAAPARDFLNQLKAGPGFDWTFLSPAMMFGPGERTGTFRLGTETLLTAPDGKSSISYEDFAVAMIDEIETPKHKNMRFTVGY